MYERMMSAPMLEWQKMTDGASDLLRAEVEGEAHNNAVRAARLGAYVGARGNGKTHAASVKHANKVVRALRKALGYSYPEATDITF